MTPSDKDVLRPLAGRYAEIANGRVMAVRREKWRLNNSLQTKTYPFHIEDNGTYFADLMPALQCRDQLARRLEWRLQYALAEYDHVDDDLVIPNRFVVDWQAWSGSYCDELKVTRADNGRGSDLGYMTNHPIKDIDADWHKLKKRTWALDNAGTERYRELAADVFAGLLPVEPGRVSSAFSDGITNRAVHLLGMEELYYQMAANPEAVHRLFDFLTTDIYDLGEHEERAGWLTLNHDGNQGYCSGSMLITHETAQAAGASVVSTDRWGYLESQESAGISEAMFDEFLMPYLTKLAAKFKLIHFGCCEAVHDFMVPLRRLPNLRKVSVTPWCNLHRLPETCPPHVIWSRKPIPLKLCGSSFSEAEMTAHLQETLDLGRDYFIEFVYRDNNLLCGEMRDRVATTCRLIRQLTGHTEGSKEG